MSTPNHFELLGLPVQPSVDSAELKAQYLKLSSSLHPDRSPSDAPDALRDTDAFIVNEAHRMLSHTPSRLKYLLTLQTGSAPGNLRQVPVDIGELFMNVGLLLRELDEVIKDKPSEDASELARVLFLKKSMALRQRNESMLNAINQDLNQLQERLDRLNDAWIQSLSNEGVTGELLDHLKQIYHEWTFLDRWRSQLSGRLLELTL